MASLELTVAMDEVTARRLRLLEEIEAGSGGLPDLGPEASPEARKRLRDDASVLLKLGLVQGAETIGGPSIAGVTAEGEALLSRARALRGEVAARRQHARLAFATWLLGQPAGLAQPDDFPRTPAATFYGQPLTPDEIQAAVTWLRQRGYLGSRAERAGTTILRAFLTASGEDWVENGGEVPQPTPTAFLNVETLNAHNSAVAIASPSASQTVGVPPEVIAKLLEAVASVRQLQSSLGLDTDQATTLKERLATLEAEASKPTPDKGLLRKAAEALGSFLKDSGAGAAGSFLGGMILHIVLGL